LKKRKKIFLGLVCAAICIVIFVVGLWPFSFWGRNEVSWLADRNGISFDGLGIAYSKDSIDLSRSFQNGEISIEIWLEPNTDANWHEERNHWHYAQILSLYNVERESEVFVVGQWRSSLNLRSRFTDSNNYKQIGLGKVLAMGRAPFITITSDLNGTSIFIDGKPAGVYPKFNLLDAGSKVPGSLILGNSSRGNSPWSGKIFGLALYNRPLTAEEAFNNYLKWTENELRSYSEGPRPIALYRFDERQKGSAYNHSDTKEHLLIPATFKIIQKSILASPFKEFRLKRSYLKDVVINIMGFVPFGFFMCAYLYMGKSGSGRRSIYLATILMGGGMSLVIELLQVYLPTRTSSGTDLVVNVLGTALGIILGRLSELSSYYKKYVSD
jgi:hypothetical protein